MKPRRRILGPLLVIATMGLAAPALADAKVNVQGKYATANGVKLHHLMAGQGEPVILLHGYAQNSHMWRPLMVELGKTRLVIAPDLRGFGDSAKPACCYDQKSMAQDIHALAQSPGIRKLDGRRTIRGSRGPRGRTGPPSILRRRPPRRAWRILTGRPPPRTRRDGSFPAGMASAGYSSEVTAPRPCPSG
jgi:hypothetical protein